MNEQTHQARQTQQLQTAALFVVSVLLILTAWGNAAIMFWTSATAMVALFIWFVADRKVWLAVITGLVFSATIIGLTKVLY